MCLVVVAVAVVFAHTHSFVFSLLSSSFVSKQASVVAREKAAAADGESKEDLELIEMQEDEPGTRSDNDDDDDGAEQEEAEWGGASSNGYHKVATSDLHEKEEEENRDQDLGSDVMKEDGKDSYYDNGGPFFKDQNEWSWNKVLNKETI